MAAGLSPPSILARRRRATRAFRRIDAGAVAGGRALRRIGKRRCRACATGTDRDRSTVSAPSHAPTLFLLRKRSRARSSVRRGHQGSGTPPTRDRGSQPGLLHRRRADGDRRRVRRVVPASGRARGAAPVVGQRDLADPPGRRRAGGEVRAGAPRRADAVARQRHVGGRVPRVRRPRPPDHPARRSDRLRRRAQARRPGDRGGVRRRRAHRRVDPRRRRHRRGRHRQRPDDQVAAAPPAHRHPAAAGASRSARRGGLPAQRLRGSECRAHARRRADLRQPAQRGGRLAAPARSVDHRVAPISTSSSTAPG